MTISNGAEKDSKEFNYDVSSGDFPGRPVVRTPELAPQGPPGGGTKIPPANWGSEKYNEFHK